MCVQLNMYIIMYIVALACIIIIYNYKYVTKGLRKIKLFIA